MYFSNLEAIVYYVLVGQEAPGGYWIAGGYTDPLDLNQINLYNVTCEFVEDGVLKSGTAPALVRLPRVR
ncbi:MAG: hypothetical protein R2751_05325 [Bacteroidales bacterium]